MRRAPRIAKSFAGLTAILILAGGCMQSPTGPEASDQQTDANHGVHAYGEG